MLQPERIGRNNESEHDLFLLSVRSLSDVPVTLDVSSKYFGVLLVCDASNIENAVVVNLAQRLIDRGMRYFCAWGNDCERVHDLVDSVIVQNDPDETEDSVIMTMWFGDESLDEALWNLLYVAFPTKDYEKDCHADLAIIVGNREWTDVARNRLSDLDRLSKDVVGDGVGEEGIIDATEQQLFTIRRGRTG